MYRYHNIFLCFLLLFTASVIKGQRPKLTKTEIRSIPVEHSSRDTPSEGNEASGTDQLSGPKNCLSMPRCSSQTVHPEMAQERQEVYSSKSSDDSGYYGESQASISASIIDTIIDSKNEEVIYPSDPELSSVLEGLFDSGMIKLPQNKHQSGHNSPSEKKTQYVDQHVLSPSQYPVRDKLARFSDFFRGLPADTKPMVELMPNTGVMVEKMFLYQLTRRHLHQPERIVQKLIESLIPHDQLVTMRFTSKPGYKVIPANILEAVEGFISLIAKPKINHDAFVHSIRTYLIKLKFKHHKASQLRASKKSEISNIIDDLFNSGYIQINSQVHDTNGPTYDKNEADNSHTRNIPKTTPYPVRTKLAEFDDFFRDLPKDNKLQNGMVELLPRSGVMINKKSLNELVGKHFNEPRKLMRRLFAELVPFESLSSRRADDRYGEKSIPKHVSDSVYAFINVVAVPKMSHEEFMFTISHFLQRLRGKSV